MKKGHIKLIEKCKLNNLLFLDLDTPEKCYLFGLLWADGYIVNNKNMLFIWLQIEDMNVLKKLLINTLPFSFYKRELKNRKVQMGAYIYSNHLISSLKNNFSFKLKSNYLFNFNVLSEENIRYFLRGYIDGDGCFSMTNQSKNGCKPFSSVTFNICSTYDHDWINLENKIKSLNIEYRIYRYKDKKNHSFSRFIISKQKQLLSFINYLYQDGFNEIGLKRKFDKAIEIRNYCIGFEKRRSELGTYDRNKS